MSLSSYRKKRRFDRTPEPAGTRHQPEDKLRFVVQKHHASRLHYDFRLELDGVLKSWAVPKGPSMNPVDKRLAVHVEDHPFDYRTFEGVIPEGNYGAGAVIVWDQGTYEALGSSDRAGSTKDMHAGLAKGHLRFVLNGEKLKGEFSLVKLRDDKGKNWLLLKKRDEFASDAPLSDNDQSVLSETTLEQVARRPGVPRRVRRSSAQKAVEKALIALPQKPKPTRVQPMLATLVKEPFDRAGWLFEIKFDGFRAIADVTKQGVQLYSRNHNSFNDRFASIADQLRMLGHEAVLDGEIVVLDHEGRSQFQLLQNYQKTGKGQLVYFVFDLLYLDGHDVRTLPLRERKELLAKVLPDLPTVKLSGHIDEKGVAFFQAASERHLEGIIAKNGASVYRERQRGNDWLKIKTLQRQEAVIGGFTAPRGRRQKLGALILGVYQDGELVYIGHTGGGLDDEMLVELHRRLEPLATKQCPFAKKPVANAPAQWVRPELVCEISFQEWTSDRRMRQPIFLGLREDKLAREVHREVPESPDAVPAAAEPRKKRSEKIRGTQQGAPVSEKQDSPTTSTPQLSLTNLNKVYWPDEGITKGDLIEYYRKVAPVVLPYLRDRPESLHRHPNGIAASSFFQKDVSKQPPPDWVQTTRLTSDDGDSVNYLLCQNEPTLLYMANLGCIELNPWNSRLGSLDQPDYVIIDLDPVDVAFDQVIEAAQAVRKMLDKAGADCCCKTSGKRGLHIYVPMGAKYPTDQVRQFAEVIAGLVNAQLPEITSLARSPASRQRRVYLDYLQNRRGQTVAAPYSVRPIAGATVSTPLKWNEVRRGLNPAKFTLHTLAARLDRVGDLWKPTLGAGPDLMTCLQRLQKLMPSLDRKS